MHMRHSAWPMPGPPLRLLGVDFRDDLTVTPGCIGLNYNLGSKPWEVV